MRAIGTWIFVMCLYGASGAMAQEVAMQTVTLSTSAILPRPNSNAMGTADVSINPSTQQLTWQMVVNGLTSAPIAVELQLSGPVGLRPAINLVPAGVEEPLRGSVTLASTEAAELMAGRYSIVLRTTAYPRGELSGVIAPP